MREDLHIQRIRYPLKLRQAQVVAIAPRGNSLLEITFRSPELIGFVSSGFDDHVKVFFPQPGQSLPLMPQLDQAGQLIKNTLDGQIIARDYTPRSYDAERGELTISFVLHHAGPASEWAAQARIGHTLGFGGPRGSMLIPVNFDWHWLIGDDCAVPAISRRLEQLPAASQVQVMLMQSQPDERLVHPCAAQPVWHHLPGTDHSAAQSPLLQLLDQLPVPAGEGFVWVAGELSTVRAIRQKLLEKGIDKRRIRAASYWQQGHAASHQNIED